MEYEETFPPENVETIDGTEVVYETEPVPAETVLETTEPAPTVMEEYTSSTVLIDYTPVIYDATSTLANVILASALMICGLLMAFKLWEVSHK